MKTIQIRNVSESVHRELRTRAARSGQSLSDYALGELERAALRPAISDVLVRAGNRPGTVDRQSLVDAVRAGRDREA